MTKKFTPTDTLWSVVAMALSAMVSSAASVTVTSNSSGVVVSESVSVKRTSDWLLRVISSAVDGLAQVR